MVELDQVAVVADRPINTDWSTHHQHGAAPVKHEALGYRRGCGVIPLQGHQQRERRFGSLSCLRQSPRSRFYCPKPGLERLVWHIPLGASGGIAGHRDEFGAAYVWQIRNFRGVVASEAGDQSQLGIQGILLIYSQNR